MNRRARRLRDQLKVINALGSVILQAGALFAHHHVPGEKFIQFGLSLDTLVSAYLILPLHLRRKDDSGNNVRHDPVPSRDGQRGRRR